MTHRFVIGSLMIVSLTASSIADVTMPSYPKGMGERCVEPTDIMHHQKISVHWGVRSKRHSLVGCVDCHASQADNGAYIPVNAPGQFCSSCHTYTAVKIDCFSCHAAVPDDVEKQ